MNISFDEIFLVLDRNSSLVWKSQNSYEFIPERHLVAYMPFGVGMRFALMELTVSLANILHRYTILSGDKCEQEMKRQ